MATSSSAAAPKKKDAAPKAAAPVPMKRKRDELSSEDPLDSDDESEQSEFEFPRPASRATPGARDITRNLPDVWDLDGARSKPIAAWQTDDVVQVRNSWSPMLSQEKMQKLCEERGFLDADGHGIPTLSTSTAWVFEEDFLKSEEGEDTTSANGGAGGGWASSSAAAKKKPPPVAASEPLKQPAIGTVAAALAGAMSPADTKPYLDAEKNGNKKRGTLYSADSKSAGFFWNEFCCRPGDYVYCFETTGTKDVRTKGRFVLQVLSKSSARPLFEKDCEEARKMEREGAGWTPELEKAIEEDELVQKQRAKIAGAAWRHFVWCRVVCRIGGFAADKDLCEELCAPRPSLLYASQREERHRVLKLLDGTVRAAAAQQNEDKSSGANSSGESLAGAAGAGAKPKPVAKMTLREKIDELLRLVSTMSFETLERGSVAEGRKDVMYLGVTGLANAEISTGSRLAHPEIVPLALDIAKTFAKKQSINLSADALTMARDLETGLHLDSAKNLKNSKNFQFTIGNFKDPKWKSQRQGRLFLASGYGPSGAAGGCSSSKAALEHQPTMLAAGDRWNPDHKNGWSARTGIVQGDEVPGYFVDTFEKLGEFEAPVVPHGTEPFWTGPNPEDHRFNFTFYSRGLAAGCKDREHKVVELKKLGFPLPDHDCFRITAADEKKFKNVVLKQNARYNEFNVGESGGGAASSSKAAPPAKKKK